MSAVQPSDREWQRFKVLLDSKRVDEAEMVGRLAQGEFAEEPRWLLVDAWVALLRGKPLDALRAAERAARATPDEPAPLRTIASALLELDKPEVALEAATAAFQLEPTSGARALIRRAQAMLGQDEEDPAVPAAVPDRRGTRGHPSGVPVPTRPRPILDQDEDESFVDEVTGHSSSVSARVGGKVAPVDLSPALESQLHALFGTSLFGPWRMQVAVSPVGTLGGFGRRGITRRHLAIGSAALAVIAALAVLFALGVRRSHERQREQLAVGIEKLLRGGSFAVLAQSLPRLDEALVVTSPDFGHVAIAARAHATLYRFYDADESRRARAEALLHRSAAAAEGRDGIVARALLLPTGERRSLREALAAFDTADNLDADVPFVLGTIARRAGDPRAAAAAYDRAERVEPANLAHLAESVDLSRQQRRRTQVANLVEQMRNVNPKDPFTRVTVACVTGTVSEQVRALAALVADAEGPDALPPVLRGHVFIELARRQQSAAGAHLAAAIAAVGRQAVPLLDYFDSLIGAGEVGLAERLTAAAGWPKESGAGRRALARIDSLRAQQARTHAPKNAKQSRRGSTRRGKRRRH